MAGDLVKTFRQTLVRIAETEQRIKADQAELAALRSEIDEFRLLLRPLLGTADVTPDDENQVKRQSRNRPIRATSTVGYAKRVLRMVGSPLHVNEIIKEIQHITGFGVSKATLVSNLSRYVGANDTFTRTAPNTFGLISYEEDREIRLVG